MCDLRDGFKLCTCPDDAPLEPPLWKLQRRDESLPFRRRVGRAMVPRFAGTRDAQRRYVLEQLVARNCFDFDYAPERDDVLVIETSRGSNPFRFRYGRKGWELDDSISLAWWRDQLVELRGGAVDVGAAGGLSVADDGDGKLSL